MKKIIIYGTGSYVLGNSHIKPVILPAIYKFLQKFKYEFEIIFIKKSSKNITLTKKKINEISKNFKINSNYKLYSLSKINNNKLLKNFKSEDIFCSIICTPDNEHYKVALDCLKKSINIIVVKPLVLSVKENLNLIKISKLNNCVGFVDYHKRFDNHSKLIKEFNLNQINNLYSIDINYSQKKIISYNIFKWVNESNILNYLGSHYIDFVFHTSGFTPKSVMAIGIKKFLYSRGINTYDSIICLVKWSKGNNEFILNLKTNWIDPLNESSMSDQKVTLHYTNSKIISDQKNRGFYISSDTDNYESVNPDFNQQYQNNKSFTKKYEGYGIESILTFLKLINKKLNGIKFKYNEYSNLNQSLVVTKVLEGASKSLKNKSNWVKI